MDISKTEKVTYLTQIDVVLSAQDILEYKGYVNTVVDCTKNNVEIKLLLVTEGITYE